MHANKISHKGTKTQRNSREKAQKAQNEPQIDADRGGWGEK